jgi:hypothetical protein
MSNHGLNNYGFADGNGNSISRGILLNEQQAHEYAQAYANSRGISVDYWIEGDVFVDDDGYRISRSTTVEPEF